MAAGEQLHIGLLGRAVPVVMTPEGLRAVSKGKPGNPLQVERYLAQKFGGRLDEALSVMVELAASWEPLELNRIGFRHYERFRPGVPAGERGWGVPGELHLTKVRGLIR